MSKRRYKQSTFNKLTNLSKDYGRYKLKKKEATGVLMDKKTALVKAKSDAKVAYRNARNDRKRAQADKTRAKATLVRAKQGAKKTKAIMGGLSRISASWATSASAANASNALSNWNNVVNSNSAPAENTGEATETVETTNSTNQPLGNYNRADVWFGK